MAETIIILSLALLYAYGHYYLNDGEEGRSNFRDFIKDSNSYFFSQILKLYEK